MNLEERFFNTFDIDPIELDYPDNFSYLPEITDEILLELICILNDTTCSVLTASTLKSLKKEILKNCIQEYESPAITEDGDEEYNEELYKKVKKLFKNNT